MSRRNRLNGRFSGEAETTRFSDSNGAGGVDCGTGLVPVACEDRRFDDAGDAEEDGCRLFWLSSELTVHSEMPESESLTGGVGEPNANGNLHRVLCDGTDDGGDDARREGSRRNLSAQLPRSADGLSAGGAARDALRMTCQQCESTRVDGFTHFWLKHRRAGGVLGLLLSGL